MNEKRAAIIIPCFDEADRFKREDFSQYLLKNDPVSFIFVNDGSRDATQDVLDEFCRSHPGRVRIIRFERNRGKAEAVRQGLLTALKENFEYMGYWDADLATPLPVINEFLSVLDKEEVLMVMGARVQLLGRNIQRKSLRHYSGRVFATAVSNILGLRVYDTQCGAKMFRNTPLTHAVFARPFVSRWIFDVEILARLIVCSPGRQEQVAKQVVEYPLKEWVDRGASKVRLVDYFLAVGDIWRIAWELRQSAKKV